MVGRVQDEENNPVESALVALGTNGVPNLYVGDQPAWMSEGAAARTAPDGTFALAVPADQSTTGAGDTPDTLLVLKQGYAAGRLEWVRTQGLAERPLLIILSRGIEMRGRITASDGSPVSDVSVAIAEDGPISGVSFPVHLLLAAYKGAGWTQSDADGRFVARVHPTVHHLAFRKSSYAPKVVRGYAAADSEGLEVHLNPAAEVRGQVVRSDGSGVPDVRLSVKQQAEFASSTSAMTGSDGGFLLEDLSPGRYQLLATKEGTGIQETRSVEVPSPDVRIVLGPTGTIRGHVGDAKSHHPVPRFMLAGEPALQGAETPLAAREISDAGGAFGISDIRAGELTLTVRAEGYVVKRLETTTVPRGSEAPDLEISLEAGATIRGRVTTKEGEALSDVIVVVTSDDNEGASVESDESGEYELRGMPPGTTKLEFQRHGFLTARKTFTSPDTTRVNATLSRGLSLRGVVLSNGVGVAGANVQASSSVVDAQYQSATTDQRGRFRIDGLVPGRHSITASAEEKGEATLEDVDVEKVGSLRLVLEQPPTAVLSGTVTGIPEGDDFVMGMVAAEGENGRSVHSPVEATGAFRMEKAPAGRVRISATLNSLSGATRASRANELTLAPASETQTVIEFRTDAVVAGTVTRDSAPVFGASVSFRAVDHHGSSSTSTDANGQYEVGGVEPGRYRVDVSTAGVSFETEYLVAGSGRFDIDVTGAALHGRAVDATDGAPIAGVDVSLWLLDGRENTPASSVTTNAKGEFAAPSLREGRYRLLTARNGYGQQTREIDLSRGSTVEVLFQLVAAEGVSVKVVDARDGRALDATVVVRDQAKRIVANQHSGAEADGTVTIALAAGQYLLSTSASGYGTATIPVTAPGGGLRVGLTPGGTLVVESERDLRGRIRLVRPDGEEYVQCWCNGIADIQLKGRRTTVPNVTAGSYTIELGDEVGAASGGTSVAIREGQVSTVRIE